MRLVVRLLLAICVCNLVAPLALPALAVGEDDPLWNKPTYEKKVTAVGQKLLLDNELDEQILFTIGHRTQNEKVNVNARAQEAGGTVIVDDGMLKYIGSDDELAFILGHEIAHIVDRHISKQMPGVYAREMLITLPFTVVGALAGPLGAFAGASIGRSISNGVNNGASRKYEARADIMGLQFMTKAGYDPEKGIAFAKKMLSDGSAGNFWRNHPKGSERVKAMNEALPHLQKGEWLFASTDIASHSKSKPDGGDAPASQTVSATITTPQATATDTATLTPVTAPSSSPAAKLAATDAGVAAKATPAGSADAGVGLADAALATGEEENTAAIPDWFLDGE